MPRLNMEYKLSTYIYIYIYPIYIPNSAISKVVRQRFSGVSITSAGTGLVRFIFVHMPDMMCPKMARLELGIVVQINSSTYIYIYIRNI